MLMALRSLSGDQLPFLGGNTEGVGEFLKRRLGDFLVPHQGLDEDDLEVAEFRGDVDFYLRPNLCKLGIGPFKFGLDVIACGVR